MIESYKHPLESQDEEYNDERKSEPTKISKVSTTKEVKEAHICQKLQQQIETVYRESSSSHGVDQNTEYIIFYSNVGQWSENHHELRLFSSIDVSGESDW